MKKRNGIQKEEQELQKNILFFAAAIGIFMLIKLFLVAPAPQAIDRWYPTSYALDYSYGFIYKGFIGTVLAIIFNNHLSLENIFIFTIVNWIIVIGLLVFMVIKLLNRLRDREAVLYAEIMIAVFLVHPYGLTAQMEQINFARTDNFYLTVLLLTVICVMCESKAAQIIAVLLCFIGVAIHTIFAVLYMPMIGILMLYKCRNSGKTDSFRLSVLIVMCILLLAEGVYLNFFSPTEFANDLNRLVLEIEEKKGFTDIIPETLFVEYAMKDSEWIGAYSTQLKDYYLSCIPCFLLLFLPIAVFFIAMWGKRLKDASVPFEKAVYCLCIASVPFTALTFFSVDWFRWMPEVFTGQIVLTLSFAYQHSRVDIDICKTKNNHSVKYVAAALAVIVLILFSSSVVKYSFFDNYLKFGDIQVEFFHQVMESKV